MQPCSVVRSSEHPIQVPVSLSAATLFFQALEKGEERAILDFKEETLDKLDFDAQELLKRLPTFIESLCSHAFSRDIACRGATILRKMIYQVVTHKSQFIKGKVYFPFDAVKRLFKEEGPIHLEGIMMYELLKEGEQDPVDLVRCFQAICEHLLKQGVFKEQELPQLAQKMREATQRFFDVQNKVNAIEKEAQQSFAASEGEKMKLLQADLDQAQQKIRETTQSFFSPLSTHPSKEWALQALNHHVEKSALEHRIGMIQQLHSLPHLYTLFQPYLDCHKATPIEIEKALDSLAQERSRLVTEKMQEELEVEYNDLCCPIRHTLLRDPVIAEDGHTYEREEIEKHLAKSNISPLTGAIIGKKLISNHVIKKLIAALQEKNKLKRPASVLDTERASKRQAVSSKEFAPVEQVKNQPNAKQQEILERIHRSPNDFQAYEELLAIFPKDQSLEFLNGEKLTYPQLLIKMIQLDPNYALAYYNLAITLAVGETIRLRDDMPPMTKQQLFLKAIELDPNFALSYVSLGAVLAPGQSVSLGADMPPMTQQQLFLKAIQLNSNYALAYFCLATTLVPGELIRLRADMPPMTKQQLYLKAIQLDPNFARAYYNLGAILAHGETIRLRDDMPPMTKQQLYRKAIQLDPNCAPAYCSLATTLAPGESIRLRDDRPPMTEQQLYLKTIQLNSNYALAYHKLANTLVVGETIRLRDNMLPMTKQQLLLKAIQLDPNYALAYYNLANILAVGENVRLRADMPPMTKQQLYLKAIQLDPNYAPAYVNLGATLAPGQSVSLGADMSPMTNQQLFIKALQIDPNLAPAYHNLANDLAVGETIRLRADMPPMTKQQLYLKEIQLDPNYAPVYCSLATTLAPGESVRLRDDRPPMTEQQLYLKAIQLDPNYALAYSKLANTLPPRGFIQLPDGTKITKQQLLDRAKELELKK